MHYLLLLCLITGAVGASAPPEHQAGTPQPALQLAAVQVEGNKRYTGADLARVGGLVLGKPITLEQIQEAANKIAASGLVNKLEYRYVTAGGRLTVTFAIEEAAWDVPVIFDNFVWFTEQQIVDAVRADVPTFDGKAPRVEGITGLISGALQKLLAARSLPGRVAFVPQTDLQTRSLQYIFKVENPSPTICRVSVDGASPKMQTDLAGAIGSLSNTAYSRFFVSSMSQGTLREMYRRLGYWGATFAPPEVAVDAGCSGVSVTLRVAEGPVYAWDRAEWSGHAALNTSELNALLGMKPNEVADASRLASGLLRVTKAYGTRGYVLARVTPTPRLDQGAARATFQMQVVEGAQFRMGTLEFSGFSESDTATLKSRWKLPAGAVYDDSYPGDFLVKEISRIRRPGPPVPAVETRVNTDASTVDVRFVVR